MIDKLHTAIMIQIKERVQCPTVMAYPTLEHEVDLPAVFVEVDELELLPDDPGDGTVHVNAHFSAHCIRSAQEEKAKLNTINMALAVIDLVNLNHWSVPNVGVGRVKTSMHDQLDPTFEGNYLWRVEWMQPIRFGKVSWSDDGVAPTKIRVGYAPDIGEHIEQYEELING